VLVLFEALILGAVGVWTAGGFLQTERTRETERKGAEQALHDSAILLNETQELAKIGGWAYDAATKTVLWSDEVYRIHEVSSRDYNPSSAVRDVAFYAPEDQATIDEAFRGAVDEGRPYDLELRLITATGREIWVRTAARPQFQDGRVVRVHGHIQDITERKMAEEELRAANERVRRLFDANLFGSLIVRENGAILEANDYYLDLIGHTRDELERGELDCGRSRLRNGCPSAMTRSAGQLQAGPPSPTRRSTCARMGPAFRCSLRSRTSPGRTK